MRAPGWHRLPHAALTAAIGATTLAGLMTLAWLGRLPPDLGGLPPPARPDHSAARRPPVPLHPVTRYPDQPAPAPATSPNPPTGRSTAPGAGDPTAVAAGFARAYLTYEWTDGPDALRQRCRPWDTDQVDAELVGPGIPPDAARRAATREVDTVQASTVDPQDRTGDHLDATVVVVATLAQAGQPTRKVTEAIDLRVVATAAGWVVGEVSQ